ncbi:M23 family metallopeptidase [Pseudoalteromonas sp. BDTF-M6]|uniref:M23 family metallopeptidase n=1 Tax=Pseudoalteromonas sp. BDTF-M6 TaxID=2796132 RepID=UPI001BAE7422|nr:M23 family metallopeptidase [Pseudoalteromonas sp. BDTF-M6]MBS3796718.1 M23 family metallopeptidase [Pseudoalteromonas sp. BDTF-M6]
MLKRLICSGFITLACLGNSLAAQGGDLPAPLVKGSLTQGAMLIGQLPNAQKVVFAERELKRNAEGYFVFGIGRDAEAQQQLKWLDKQGQWQQLDFTVSQRDYKIDKIEGVEQKYVAPPKEVLERISSDAAMVREARAKESDLTAFMAPVYRPAQGRISGVYGSQRYFNGTPKRPHFGLDIANKTGTPIYAPLPGRVVFAHPDLYYSGGTVIIDHGHGISSTYIHMHKVLVDEGEMIKTGERIGQIGATGRVTGPHLDWRFNWFNTRLDPQLMMIDTLASETNTND